MTASGPPRLCFVGPMLGKQPGRSTSQGELLAQLMAGAGYDVVAVSDHANRYVRLLDIASTIVMRRKTVDVQMLQVFGGLSFVTEDVASAIGRMCGHRIVMILRGGAMPEFVDRHPRWARRVLARADVLITPSAYLRRELEARGFHAQVIPNVLEISRYPYRHRDRVAPRLFWMRSFHPIYNPSMAIRVLARLRAAHADVTLAMGGDDKGSLEAVRGEAAHANVAAAVRFAGFLTLEGKQTEGAAADIFINTNRIDNMPVSVLEAFAMGLPVVSTDVGGMRDLIEDGVTGLLVGDDDDRAMAAAIERLIAEPGLAAMISANAREVALGSAWERLRDRWAEVLMPASDEAERAGAVNSDVRHLRHRLS